MRLLIQGIRSFSQRASPTTSFDFIPATSKDLGPLVDLCCTDFIRVEPHCKALNFKREDSEHLFEWIVGKCLLYPYSYKILEKNTSRLVGFRVMSVGHRDSTLDKQPFELDESRLTEKTMKLAEMLNGVKDQFWKLADEDVQKVLRREITFVLEEHHRKGIAKHLVHLGLDFKQLRADGFDGIVSEASSIANQTLLKNEGYEWLIKTERQLKMHDGTEDLKGFFKDLRKY